MGVMDLTPEGQGINRETLMKDGEVTNDVVIGQTGFNKFKWRTVPDGKVCEKQDGSEGLRRVSSEPLDGHS